MLHPTRQLAELQSPIIRAITEHLLLQGHTVRFVSQPWSKVEATWVYVDVPLAMDALKQQFDPEDQLEYHENLDPKSGTERGWVDMVTGEAIMGRLY